MKTTEQSSNYENLDKMTTLELLRAMNAEDMTVPMAVGGSIPQIEQLVEGIVERMKRGGRVFYIGAGTSGRLGIVDASEIPPTYGVQDKFIGIIAGGDGAIHTAVEGAEDDWEHGRGYPCRYCCVGYYALCNWCCQAGPGNGNAHLVHHQ